LSPGDTGSESGGASINGGGGVGEAPTVIFDHSTNKRYVGEVFPVPFRKSFLNNNSVNPDPRLIKFLGLNILQAELCPEAEKMCTGFSPTF
jgi:hypothetical protein